MRQRLVTVNRRLAALHRRSPAFRRLWLYVWALAGVAVFYQVFAAAGLIPS